MPPHPVGQADHGIIVKSYSGDSVQGSGDAKPVIASKQLPELFLLTPSHLRGAPPGLRLRFIFLCFFDFYADFVLVQLEVQLQRLTGPFQFQGFLGILSTVGGKPVPVLLLSLAQSLVIVLLTTIGVVI